MAKAVTLKMIADRVGVSKSTVSDVLRERNVKIKVSESTREKIFQAVRDLDYVPNAAARALVTGKTNNIGFLLSSKTNLGLANNYFASIMSGVQVAAEAKGYNCIVNCYDLSSIKKFVMPSKIKRKAVDGLVISGRIEEDILQMFFDCGLPFILVGENADFPVEGVLTVARNISDDWNTAFDYLAEAGHRSISVGGIETELGYIRYRNAVEKFKKSNKNAGIDFSSVKCIGASTDIMKKAYEFGRHWARQGNGRPTAVIGHDQWCIGFLSAAMDAGFSCPEDVSVISTCDTSLCKWFRPAISAIELPLFDGGKSAAELLMDFIDRKINWIEANRKASAIWNDHKLILRDSTAENILKSDLKKR